MVVPAWPLISRVVLRLPVDKLFHTAVKRREGIVQFGNHPGEYFCLVFNCW